MSLAEEKEHLWIYPNGDCEEQPELWMRKGHCTRCGECCKLHWLFGYAASGAMGESPPPLPPLASVPQSGFGSTPLVAEDWEGYWRYWQRKMLKIDHAPCGSYDGNGICSSHGDPERKEICRKWPVLPSDLDHLLDCGFSFERADDEWCTN